MPEISWLSHAGAVVGGAVSGFFGSKAHKSYQDSALHTRVAQISAKLEETLKRLEDHADKADRRSVQVEKRVEQLEKKYVRVTMILQNLTEEIAREFNTKTAWHQENTARLQDNAAAIKSLERKVDENNAQLIQQILQIVREQSRGAR